jgi:heterodisulfide reductase subunit C
MVAAVSAEYKPRQLIQKILLGMRDVVLTSPLPWLCMSCRMCEERCQEDVSPSEVMKAVRLLAATEGNVPAPFRTAIDIVLRDGWMLKDAYSDFNEEEREDLGLDPELQWNSEFTKRLKERYFKGSESN